jgi:hypothetical protein
MGLTTSLANPDVWFHPAVKSDGFQYYEYVLAYVDDTWHYFMILRKYWLLYPISITLRKDMRNQLIIWELK